MKVPEVTTRALRPDDWPVIERLFGKQGACGGGWCMWWRVAASPKEWEKLKGGTNRAVCRPSSRRPATRRRQAYRPTIACGSAAPARCKMPAPCRRPAKS